MKSKSEEFLENRNRPPLITPNMYKNVSDYRKATLENEVNNGLFRDGNSDLTSKNTKQTSASNVISSSAGIKKDAQATTSNAFGSGWRGSGGSVRQTPEVYSPLWLNSNLNLPRDRATINAWCRSFYALNPIVQNAINLHSTYPISKLNIRCPNKKIERHFNEMIEETDLINICIQVAQEYWLLGESFVYGELSEDSRKWERFVVQNPDYITIQKSPIASEPIISLRPDENLRRIVFSNKSSDISQRNQLNPNIIEHIKSGRNIPLDNFFVSHLARKPAPYEVRGTGLPVCVFRQLMLFDKLRESKFAQADGMINPMTLIKVGSADYKPTFTDLEMWRETFEAAQYDKDFKIFTHEAVDVQKIGSGAGIYDISGDVTQLLKEIYIGLMVPQVLMEAGDITYANGGVALDVLRQRYMSFRNMMSAWLKRKVFAPISKINDFYEYSNNEKKLIVPEVEWNHMSLFDASDYINVLVSLSGEKKNVSTQTLYKSLGLEWEEEQRKMRQENIAAVIYEKEQESMKKMSLNELRALGEDDEIPEISETPLPGEGNESSPAGDDSMLPGVGSDMPPPPPPV